MANTRGRDESEAHRAVCFDRRDYAGPVRRAVVVCIDFVVAIALSFGVLLGIVCLWLIRHPKEYPSPEIVWVMPLVAYVYLTIVARSRIRTLGCIITGMRIADIRGRRPSLLQMTIRLVPLLPVPWSFLFDLGWIMDEPQRQTLRDKWAGTYVVRRGAKPIGTAPVRYKRIGFCGLFFIFPEIAERSEKKQEESQSEA